MHEVKAVEGSAHSTKLSTVRTSPKWSFKGKPSSPKKYQTPGPGDYQGSNLDLNTMSRKGHGNPLSGFGGTTPRDQPKRPSAPGPGAYCPSDPTQVSTKHGFGTAPRRGTAAKIARNPGPGTYVHKEVMGCEGPKFSVAPRRQDRQGSSHIPGPGSYEVQSSAVTESVPKYGFGNSPRSVRKRSSSPGPGAYGGVTAENCNASPKPTIGCRREAPKVATSPGPGDYCGAQTTFGY